MADPRNNVLKGVTRALVKVGEDLTVQRTVTTPDPNNPTMPGTDVTESHTCRGYIYPHTRWNPTNMVTETVTQVIMDSQSFDPAFVPALGDIVVTGTGQQYRLSDRHNPPLLGQDMAFIHDLGVV